MNKIILMGRLTRDPEVRYSSYPEPINIVKFTLAVNRRFKKNNEPEADFFECVAFGKTGEFVSKYFKKGLMVGVVGRIRTGTYIKDGIKHFSADVIVEEAHFAESKASYEARTSSRNDYHIDNENDDDLPF